MRPTIFELMDQTGCKTWPERWKDIYGDVMTAFETNGCPMTDPEHIVMLADRYGLLTDQKELYQQAALSVANQEPLARLLALLCATLADPEHRDADLAQFVPFYDTGENPNLGVNMLPGLALLSQMPECYRNLKALGLPEEEIVRTMRIPEITVGLFRKMHHGAPGFHRLHWYQRIIKGSLFRVGRLEIELPVIFSGRAQVFQNESGELLALGHERWLHISGVALGSRGAEDETGAWEANVEETDTHWVGYPFRKNGLITGEKVSLPKSEWKRVLRRNDPAVALHIPEDGPLTPALVTESMARIREFLKTWFPDYAYAAFTCVSWLINPEVVSLLGPDANISKFSARFCPLTHKASGEAVFPFIFHCSAPKDFTELPENTRLERALKAYYLSGKILYEMYGFFL